MAWWQNFAGGGTLKFPLEVELLPGVLTTRISFLEFTFLGQEISCWCYTSVGLADLGQRELIFILKKEPQQDLADFPQAPCEFFKTAAGYALRGEFVEEGSVSEFGPSGFLVPGFRGFGYVYPHHIGEWTPSADALAIIMLTEQELECARVAGLTRAIGLLGMAHLHYPCPIWNSLGRVTSVSSEDIAVMRASLMSELPRLSLKGATVCSRDNTLHVRLPHGCRQTFEQIDELDEDVPLIVLCGLAREADSLLVWSADETAGPVAIKAPQAKGERVAGAYVCFVPNQSTDRVLTKEDGFAVSLTQSNWHEVRAALAGGSNFLLAPQDGAAFSLEWYEEEAAAAADEQAVLRAQALGLATSCSGGQNSAVAAITRQVKLLTHEPEVQERIDADKLFAYIEHLQEVFSEHFRTVGEQEGFDLLIECTLSKGADPVFVVNSRPVIEQEDVEDLIDRLSITFAPAVSESSVSFFMEVAVWGGCRLEGAHHDQPD